MGLFSRKKKEDKQPVISQKPKRPVAQLSFKAAGISNYAKAVKSLAEGKENDWYTATAKEIKDASMDEERIYQYDFNVRYTELIPEPNNQYDKNAIKIVADGEHIGYVPKAKCKTVKEIMDTKEIKGIHCDLYGGKYKYVSSSGTDKGETEYGATVDIFYYEE